MYISVLYVLFRKSVFSEMGVRLMRLLTLLFFMGYSETRNDIKQKTSVIKFLRFSVGSDGFEPPKSKDS